jgi:hypothetical protein
MNHEMKELNTMHRHIQNIMIKMNENMKIIIDMQQMFMMKHDDIYITALYDDISVGERVYFNSNSNNGERIDIGDYPFTEFKNKGAHNDPLGGWFTNPQNKKLIGEYPHIYKLGRYDIDHKIQFEEKRKAFNETFFDGTNKIVFL